MPSVSAVCAPSAPRVCEIPGWPGDIEKGSALDFSGLLDGPAGKYGRVIAMGEKFAFENAPQKFVRFYGVNLSAGANFLDKAACRRLVDRLAASGYNAVRIHHHERILVGARDERAVELDPVEMDKLDFLFHCCKERGIYLTTDLYVSRLPREIITELGRPARNWEEFKFLIHLLDAARKNWEDFSRNFLEHVNPYTGLAWKDDPALATLSLVNEDAIFHCYKNANADVRAIYDRSFGGWLARRNCPPESPEETVALRNLFLFETCRASMVRMREFVRSLGCRTLLTDQNHWSIVPMSLLRQPCDYVDDHFYWDHPEGCGLPSRLLDTSCLSDLPTVFSGIFPGRCFGKPYTVSEFNWVYPNRHRAESAPLTAAYAALQDWAGLYRYSYSHSAAVVDGTLGANFFDIAADPINLLSDRIGLLLFLRGDVQASSLQIPFVVSPDHMEAENPVLAYPGQAWKLGFLAQVGTVVGQGGNASLPPRARAGIRVNDGSSFVAGGAPELQAYGDPGQGSVDWNGGPIRSSTGELEIHAEAGTFHVTAAQSEVVVLSGEGRLDGPVLSVDAREGPLVVSASALDGRGLAESRRVLLVHLGEAIHEGTRFVENLVEEFGAEPKFLVGPSAAEVTLRLVGPASEIAIWALDLSGKRVREIEFRREGDSDVTFVVDVLRDGSPVFLYEILRTSC